MLIEGEEKERDRPRDLLNRDLDFSVRACWTITPTNRAIQAALELLRT